MQSNDDYHKEPKKYHTDQNGTVIGYEEELDQYESKEELRAAQKKAFIKAFFSMIPVVLFILVVPGAFSKRNSDEFNFYLMGGIFGVVGIFFLAMLIASIAKERKIKREFIPIKARVVSRDVSSDFNKTDYEYIYQGQRFLKKVDGAISHEVGEEQTILINPEDPFEISVKSHTVYPLMIILICGILGASVYLFWTGWTS